MAELVTVVFSGLVMFLLLHHIEGVCKSPPSLEELYEAVRARRAELAGGSVVDAYNTVAGVREAVERPQKREEPQR